MIDKRRITSFQDLDVYRNTYGAMVVVMAKIIPKLPASEKYDLVDQISRACKSAPRLIAEGYAKRHQKAGFQKYLDDAMAECNEMVVSLSQCRDIYPNHIEASVCEKTLDLTERRNGHRNHNRMTCGRVWDLRFVILIQRGVHDLF